MFAGKLCEKLYFCSKRCSLLTTTRRAPGAVRGKIIKYLDVGMMLLRALHSDPITMRNHKIQKEHFLIHKKARRRKICLFLKCEGDFFVIVEMKIRLAYVLVPTP